MLRIKPCLPQAGRLISFLGSFLNRRFIFTTACIAVLSAKFVHILGHRQALYRHVLLKWGYSFLGQDIVLFIFLRLLLDHWTPSSPKLRIINTAVASILILYNVILGFVTVAFYAVSGSEIHWRNIAVATDATSRSMLLGGTVSLLVVVLLTALFSWLLQNVFYGLFGLCADIIHYPLALACRTLLRVRRQNDYGQIAQEDAEGFVKQSFSNADFDHDALDARALSPASTMILRQLNKLGVRMSSTTFHSMLRISAYLFAFLALFVLLVLTIMCPGDGSLSYLQWTVGMLPFVDFSSASPTLFFLPSHFGTGIQYKWDNESAIAEAPHFDWLPKKEDVVLGGFDDWQSGKPHYNAAVDPMKVSNLDEPVLTALRDKLQDVPIRHVFLCLLESTRNDVFPIKKDGFVWERLAGSFPNKKISKEAYNRLATLTPTANFITGDYDDGFEHAETPKRGGIHFTNAKTTGTYTLKSMVGTFCGLAPLIADFNLDWKHHIYQPCLPQIFEALNTVNESSTEKWKSYFFQAATLHYDNHDNLMHAFGFPWNNTIDLEYLRSENATHGRVDLPKINYFAFEEDPLEDYFRDVFVSAKEKNERVFLSHITTTSHHAYNLPANETYVELSDGLEELSKYINTEGYDDKWIRKVLNLLDEQGVANETLIIFVGDHGISIPENGNASPYYNPSIGIDHVPLILSHPKLPAFDVHDAVHSAQILPTILDLLLETGSLDEASHHAVSDLVRNYEGQSLIRPLQKFHPTTGEGNWQYTLINPGRALVTARDTRYPERHLAVPIIDNVEWRFSNLTEDPHQERAIQSLDFLMFLDSVEKKHGVEVAKWVEEGAFMTRWWVEENSKRWRYGAYAERSKE